MGNCIHRGPTGEPVGVLFKGDSLRDRWRGALEMEHLSVWQPVRGILMGEGGSFTRDLEGYAKKGQIWRGAHLLGILTEGWRGAQEICIRRLWKHTTLSTGGPNGEPGRGGGSFTGGIWDTVIIGLHFLDPENVRSLGLGTMGRSFLPF